jgi:hypothetical protein
MGGKMTQDMPCAEADNELGTLFLKMLWVRDQAHIFHWQTPNNAQHVMLGDFYDAYLGELDELAEGVFGQSGKTFTLGKGKIDIMDYSEENVKMFLNKAAHIFQEEFPMQFPNTPLNLGLYHTVGDILELINKAKYLNSQK